MFFLDNKSREKTFQKARKKFQSTETSKGSSIVLIIMSLLQRLSEEGNTHRTLKKTAQSLQNWSDNQQRSSVIRHTHKLISTLHDTIFITEDLCPDWKQARLAQISLYNKMKK